MSATTDAGRVESRRENFVPFTRRTVVKMCLEDIDLPRDAQKGFQELCEILTAWNHFDFLQVWEAVREHYDPLDPDRDTICLEPPEALAEHEMSTVDMFRDIAERANYFEVSEDTIEECFHKTTLIDLSTFVDLRDFERVLCFARGDVHSSTTVRKWFRSQQVDFDVLKRVVLLLKFRDEQYFHSSGKKEKQLAEGSFQPGSLYVWLYRDVPRYDLELLFPNVQIGMNLRQKLMFAVPLLGGSIAVLIKTLPQLLIIAALVLFLVGGTQWLNRTGVDQQQVTHVMPVVTSSLALGVALGGFAVRQWGNFRRKQLKFLKDVGAQLFFRHLGTNRAAFARLIESAEEEESKELVMVLFHLMKDRRTRPTARELDESI
ncbi:MAG: TMEM143 family protein [Planctomycetaceae bacterium]